MGGVELLQQARDAGLQVGVVGDKIRVTGPKSAESLARELLNHKAELMPVLESAEARRNRLEAEPAYPAERDPPIATSQSSRQRDWVGPSPGERPHSIPNEPRWITGELLDKLSEPLQGLVCAREGWTPTSWAAYLEHKAARCATLHPCLADHYRFAAKLLRTGKNEPI